MKFTIGEKAEFLISSSKGNKLDRKYEKKRIVGEMNELKDEFNKFKFNCVRFAVAFANNCVHAQHFRYEK